MSLKYPTNPLFDLPWPDAVYLRVCIKPDILPRVLLPYIQKQGKTFGIDPDVGLINASSPDDGHKKVVVEFSSPNIATDFHGKHLRSTILGAFVSNIHKSFGWEVKNVNYLGDWGKDLALLCVGWLKFGSDEEYSKNPAAHILDVHQKIQEEFGPEQAAYKTAREEAKKSGKDGTEIELDFENQGLHAERNAFLKKVEDGDEEDFALFKRIRDLRIDEYSKFYTRLNICFDEYSGESQVSHETTVELEKLLKEKEMTEESEGKSVIDMKKYGAKTGKAVIRDRAGSSAYFLRYLAAVLDRSRKQDFDKMLFVNADRTGHFSRLIKVFEALGMDDLASKLQPVLFSDLSHMTEKLGDTYQPHTILDQCEKVATDILEANEAKARVFGPLDKVIPVFATTALLAQETSTKRGSDHVFDINTMVSFKNGIGPELQYEHSRLSSFLKAHPSNAELVPEDYNSLMQENHTSILLLLGQYPEVVHAAYETLEPSHITTYLRNLVEQLSNFLDDEEDDEEGAEQDAGGESSQAAEKDGDSDPAIIALYEASRIVFENGMNLLGLTPIANLEQDRVDSPVAE